MLDSNKTKIVVVYVSTTLVHTEFIISVESGLPVWSFSKEMKITGRHPTNPTNRVSIQEGVN